MDSEGLELTDSRRNNGEFFSLLGKMNQNHFDSFKNSMSNKVEEPILMSVKDTSDLLRLKFAF